MTGPDSGGEACGAVHPNLAKGNACREPSGHAGRHLAHDSQGRPEYAWSGPDAAPEVIRSARRSAHTPAPTVPDNAGLREVIAGWLFDFTMRRDGAVTARWADPSIGVSSDREELLSDRTLRAAWRSEADRVLDLPALAALLAERDRAVGQVAAVRQLADEMTAQAEARGGRRYRPARTLWHFADRIRRALGDPT